MPSVTIQIFVFTKMEKKATDVAPSTALGEKLQPSSFVLSPQDLTGGPAVQPYPRSPKLNRKTGRSPPLTEVRGERKTEMREEMYVCMSLWNHTGFSLGRHRASQQVHSISFTE